MRFTSVKTDGPSDVSVHLHGFREHLKSREIIAALAGKDLSVESSEAVISQIRGRIAVEPDTSRDAQPGAFLLSYRATEPETARRTTDEMADRLLTLTSKEPSSAISEAEVVRRRVAEIAIQLRELEHNDPWLSGVRSDLSVTMPPLSPRSSHPSPEAIHDPRRTLVPLSRDRCGLMSGLSITDKNEEEVPSTGLKGPERESTLILTRRSREREEEKWNMERVVEGSQYV
jgi:hypothetical protein